MRSVRINPIAVAVIGSVLSILAVVLITFILIKPTQEKYNADKARWDAAYPDSTGPAQTSARKLLDKNKAEARATYAKWDATQKALMPPFDVSNRYEAWGQLAHELSYNLGPSLERWITRTGVIRQTAITVPAPPNSPNDLTNGPLRIPVSGGAISVGGDFRTLLTHVVQWNNFNRLVLIDGLALSGNSPFMQGSYRAQVIIFPQNPTNIGKTLDSAGVGGTAGARGGLGGAAGFPGGPGGPGGGYPGGAYHGGDVAAPVFRQIAEQILPDMGVMPDTEFKNPELIARAVETPAQIAKQQVDAKRIESERQQDQTRAATLPRVAARDNRGGEIVYASAVSNSMLMPDLRGRSVRDAARACAQLGIQVEARGEGGRVVAQSPQAGSGLRPGQVVYIDFGRVN